MIPKFGNTIIIFGSGKDAAEKLGKLRLFYKEVMVKAGWNKYSEINVQYKNQLVAKRKGAEEVKADSLLTLQLIQVIAENAARMASDSVQTIVPDNEHNTTNNNIIQQSIERDDNSTTGNDGEAQVENKTPATTGVAPDTANKPAVTIIKKPAVIIKKPVASKPATPAAKPAVVVIKPAAKPTVTGSKQPKLVMPKPIPKKPGTTKPVNEY
jgi:hypothetical protein